jgi:hypothetical protein
MVGGEDRAEGFAAESLKGSGQKPSQSGGIHAEAGDGVASHRSLTGRDSDEESAMTPKIPGSRTDPASIPQESHGGSNARGVENKQSKDGNGAQKRQQQKKS